MISAEKTDVFDIFSNIEESVINLSDIIILLSFFSEELCETIKLLDPERPWTVQLAKQSFNTDFSLLNIARKQLDIVHDDLKISFDQGFSEWKKSKGESKNA